MPILLYIRLIGYTAGTLLMLFWMVVILGYRRQRNFERVFFFLCLALFFFYSGSLLALNAQIHYAIPPPTLEAFAGAVLYAGLCLLPPLLVHLHLEFADTRGLIKSRGRKRVALLAGYAPVPYFVLAAYPHVGQTALFNWILPAAVFGKGYGLWLGAAMLVGAACDLRFASAAEERLERSFHRFLAAAFCVGAILAIYLHTLGKGLPVGLAATLSTIFAFLAIPPSALLIYMVQRHNFLQIGRQRNLVYAVSVTFLALLYLSLVRRVGVWLEPVLPPEASAAILLFVLVVFIEPLQRLLGRRLQETAQREVDRALRVTSKIQQVARQGNSRQLVQFIEAAIQSEFELASATLTLFDPASAEMRLTAYPEGHEPPGMAPSLVEQTFFLHSPQGTVGLLRAEPHGAMLSGETRAALQQISEGLPALLHVCRLIEEKIKLERQLAERERMAALGQMAASISHNLKNPLGSIKTILQVQLENSELPESLRGETRLMLDEITRLSMKLNQLLQFSRPAVLGEGKNASCDASEIAREVIGVLRHEAEQKGLALELVSAPQAIRVAAGTEGVRDILSNLVVNALDATPSGGRVEIEIAAKDNHGTIAVTDTGPGVPAGLREKILQPFFTTKAHGTGLGLAIIARRVAEAGGTLDFLSPTKDGRGARFVVGLPLAQESEGKVH